LVHLEGHDPVSYDYLVIATGFSVDYDYVPGLREYAHSIIGRESHACQIRRWSTRHVGAGRELCALLRTFL